MVLGSLEGDNTTVVHMFMFVEEQNKGLVVLGSVYKVE